jgi:DNA-binding NarL/FixJ family response regulator
VARVAIVEDNAVFRQALEILLGLSPDLEVVAAAPDGQSGVEACAAERPDVVVLDYRLPDLDGVETARGILAASPGTAVVALTAAADGPQVDALLAAGAVACLSKDRGLEDILAAVRSAARGDDRG